MCDLQLVAPDDDVTNVVSVCGVPGSIRVVPGVQYVISAVVQSCCDLWRSVP